MPRYGREKSRSRWECWLVFDQTSTGKYGWADVDLLLDIPSAIALLSLPVST